MLETVCLRSKKKKTTIMRPYRVKSEYSNKKSQKPSLGPLQTTIDGARKYVDNLGGCSCWRGEGTGSLFGKNGDNVRTLELSGRRKKRIRRIEAILISR